MSRAVERYLAGEGQAVDRCLERILAPGAGVPEEFSGAVRYAVFSGGKRIRPILLIHLCRLCGVPRRRALPAAAALELIHAFSLVQDDLPAMDNDDFRRGKPTLHRAYGEATALLASDYLLVRALELLAGQYPPAVMSAAVRAIGPHGLLGGQYLDLLWQGKAVPADVLETIRLRKTAALFELTFLLAALISGGRPRRRGLFADYGRTFGLAFQVRDDLADAEAAESRPAMAARLEALAGRLADLGRRAGLDSPVLEYLRGFLLDYRAPEMNKRAQAAGKKKK